MNRRFFTNKTGVDRQIKSMQCTVTIDSNTLTALVGQIVTLTAKVEPLGTYDVNFKASGNLINIIPIPTDPLSGIATLSLDTTSIPPGLYDLTVEVITPPPLACVSSPLTVALTTTTCTGITINNPSPIRAYIGDIISASATATITEQSIIEFVDNTTNMRFGSCIISPLTGQCTANIDTTGAPPGTYSTVAKVGNGLAQQCISTPVDTILQERPGKIVAISIPPGARIYYDGNDIGMNSSAIISDVTPNVDHEVRLTLSGYSDYIESAINISPGNTGSIFAMMVPTTPPTGVGNLSVTSIPDGVEFGLYTGEIDIAPVTLYDIPAGINAYEAGLTGYNGAMGSVIIKAGETINLNIPLQLSTPDMGIVAIESIPMGSDIYIDELPLNTKTSFMTFMAPGSHTYKLRLSGYQDKSGSFTVVTGYDVPAIVSEVLQPVSGAGTAMLFGIVGIAALGMMMTSKPSRLASPGHRTVGEIITVGIKEEGVK